MSRYYLKRIPHSIVFATSLESLYNNHKINFDDTNIGAGTTRHTSLDWFMAPTERPSIEKAAVKENYIDIPGINGGLDLTESLTGFPLYNYIEGSFEFNILNDRKLPILNSIGEKIGEKDISWEVLNRDIRSFLNGKRRFMMLEDDPSWYYEGRFTVGRYDASEASNSKIIIEYKVYPYRKLSTCINTSTPLNSFFDTVSLTKDDLSELQISFWNKTNVDIYPDKAGVRFNGNTRGSLPCGDENTTITLKITRPALGCILLLNYTDADGISHVETLDTPVGTTEIKLRRYTISNNTLKGVLYSDNIVAIYYTYPEEYNTTTKGYNIGDYISYYDGETTVVLIAKEDIEVGETFDISKWEIVPNGTDPVNLSIRYDIGVM